MDWSNIGTGVQEEKQQREQLENQIADEGKKPLSLSLSNSTQDDGEARPSRVSSQSLGRISQISFFEDYLATMRRNNGNRGSLSLSLSLWG